MRMNEIRRKLPTTPLTLQSASVTDDIPNSNVERSLDFDSETKSQNDGNVLSTTDNIESIQLPSLSSTPLSSIENVESTMNFYHHSTWNSNFDFLRPKSQNILIEKKEGSDDESDDDQLIINGCMKNVRRFTRLLISFQKFDIKKRLHQAIRKVQDKQHKRTACGRTDDDHGLWFFVKNGDLVEIEQWYKRKQKLELLSDSKIEDLVDKRDIVGANIIHLAYLYKQYKVAHWLVKKFPGIALKPYETDYKYLLKSDNYKKYINFFANNRMKSDESNGVGPGDEFDIEKVLKGTQSLYGGENILHMVLVRNNFAEARWLLEFYKTHPTESSGLSALLLANAKGTFFHRSGEFYCGCYPIHFAACTGDTQLFDLVVSYLPFISRESQISVTTPSVPILGSNAIFMRDSYGNNCLHLCVIHGLSPMYSHIKKVAKSIIEIEINLMFRSALAALAKKQLSDNDLMKNRYVRVNFTFQDFKSCEGLTYGYMPLETGVSCLRQKDDIRKCKPIYHDIVELNNEDQCKCCRGHAYAPINTLTQEYRDWVTIMTKRKLDERLELVLNEDFHSPLTLCGAYSFKRNWTLNEREYDEIKRSEKAEQIKRDTIEHILSEMQSELWTYGSIRTSILSMEGVEIAYDYKKYPTLPTSARKSMHSLVEWICIKNSIASAKIPAIQSIIKTKWHYYGSKIFAAHFLFRLIVTILVTALLFLYNSIPLQTNGRAPQADMAASSLLIIIFILIVLWGLRCNLSFFLAYGIDYWGLRRGRYWHVRGAAKYEKFIDTVFVLSFFSLFINELLRLNRTTDDTSDDIGTKVSFSICIFSAWLYPFYFFMGLQWSGPFVLTVYKIITVDIPYFVFFYIMVIVAFGCALSLLTNSGDTSFQYNVWHVLYCIYDLIQITVGMQQVGNYHSEVDSSNVPDSLKTYFSILLTVFYFTVSLMFLNLLIAMINSTYNHYTQFDKTAFSIEKYNMMCVWQKSALSPKLLRRQIVTTYVSFKKLLTNQSKSEAYTNVTTILSALCKRVTESICSLFTMIVGSIAALLEVLFCFPWRSHRLPESYSLFDLDRPFDLSHVSGDKNVKIKLDDYDSDVKYMFELVDNRLSNRQPSNRHSTHDIHTYPQHDTHTDRRHNTHSGTEIHHTDSRMKVDNESEMSPEARRNTLFIIMPQNDFHEGLDGIGGCVKGSLSVPGSNADSRRISAFITKNIDKIDQIIVALDTHQQMHIAHAAFWKAGNGKDQFGNPNPLNKPESHTTISYENIEDDFWVPVDKNLTHWAKYYTTELCRHERLKLTIWPEHCIVTESEGNVIESEGHKIFQFVQEALDKWETKVDTYGFPRNVLKVKKGQNCFTELFSVLKAEVVNETDPSTAFDWDLFNALRNSDKIFVCGQALR